MTLVTQASGDDPRRWDRTYLPGDPSAGYEQAGTWYSALTDHLGSPHSYVSEAGVQGTITRWDPFGAARPGSTAAGGIGFAGEWRDPTGLIDLRARAYDPGLGRFTSRDALGGLAQVPQTANRYAYALNGPYRYADPSGRFVNLAVANAPLFLSLAIQSIPVVGDAYSALTGLIGYDPIAGISLSTSERAAALGGAAILGGGFHLLARLSAAAPDAARLGRVGEAVGDGFSAVGARTSRAFDSIVTSRPVGRLLGLDDAARGIRVSDGVAGAGRYRATLGRSSSSDYRSTFFRANPSVSGEVWVHHAVEQGVQTRYPGVVSPAEIHSIENLRGIPIDINRQVHLSQIRREWNEFYRRHPHATRDELLDEATRIDLQYGQQLNPPVGE